MSNVGITEVVLRDGNQSLLATRISLEDLLPAARQLDEIGYWSIESWGGATFDVCLRHLNEDPWERLKELKKAMPKTPQQMLLRGQNLVGYKHFSDQIVSKFINKSAENGIDVFRIFDALNDIENIRFSLEQVKENNKHAQAAMAYTTSPIHNIQYWIDLAKSMEDIGIDSIAIKDMAGITPGTNVGGFNTEVFGNVTNQLNNIQSQAEEENNIANTTGNAGATNTNTANKTLTVSDPILQNQINELTRVMRSTNSRVDHLTTNLT